LRDRTFGQGNLRPREEKEKKSKKLVGPGHGSRKNPGRGPKKRQTGTVTDELGRRTKHVGNADGRGKTKQNQEVWWSLRQEIRRSQSAVVDDPSNAGVGGGAGRVNTPS